MTIQFRTALPCALGVFSSRETAAVVGAQTRHRNPAHVGMQCRMRPLITAPRARVGVTEHHYDDIILPIRLTRDHSDLKASTPLSDTTPCQLAGRLQPTTRPEVTK
jgi:hypothetical protein